MDFNLADIFHGNDYIRKARCYCIFLALYITEVAIHRLSSALTLRNSAFPAHSVLSVSSDSRNKQQLHSRTPLIGRTL
jgi:hypothetical protein